MKITRLLQNTWSLLDWPLQTQNLKLSYLAGQSVDTVQAWIEEAWSAEIQKRLFPGWISAIEWLRSQRAEIVLVSGTPFPLALPLMRDMQIDHAICAEPEIKNKFYTGRLLKAHPKGALKVLYADQWLKTYGATWDQTIACANDWPDHFLFRCSAPVVLHPSWRLYLYARYHNWPIVNNTSTDSQIIQCLERQWNYAR